MRLSPALLVLALAGAPALAADHDLSASRIVFARDGALVRSDARGKNEVELTKLPADVTVRALRTDALGKILLVDLDGAWSWMPLDGTKPLTPLPCDTGPAQLAEDGHYVFCRHKNGGSLVVNLVSGKLTPIGVPTLGARLLGTGTPRKLVWADKGAVWSAVPPKLERPIKVTKQAPLRSLLPSPDGTRAVGVFAGEVYEGPRTKKPGEILMVFALDGEGAGRKAIQNGVPVEWSHDGKWILLQDRASACIMFAAGGQYKCWRGFTAASISPDGRYALLLGNRSTEKKSDKKDKKDKKKKGKRDKRDPEPTLEDAAENPEAEGDAHGDVPIDDVAVPPPSGPLSLYRAELDGAFTKSPALVTREVAGAAVWIPDLRPGI